MPKTTLALKLEAAAAMTETAAYDLENMKFGLFLEKPGTAEPLVAGDFTLPTAGAYDRKVVDIGGDPILRADGSYSLMFDAMDFGGNAGQLPVTFKGWYLIDNETTKKVLAWGYFTENVVFTALENFARFIPRLNFQTGPNTVDCVVANH